MPGAFKVICLAIALMFLAGRGRGDRMKSGSTLVSRLTNVQPAGLIISEVGTPGIPAKLGRCVAECRLSGEPS